MQKRRAAVTLTLCLLFLSCSRGRGLKLGFSPNSLGQAPEEGTYSPVPHEDPNASCAKALAGTLTASQERINSGDEVLWLTTVSGCARATSFLVAAQDSIEVFEVGEAIRHRRKYSETGSHTEVVRITAMRGNEALGEIVVASPPFEVMPPTPPVPPPPPFVASCSMTVTGSHVQAQGSNRTYPLQAVTSFAVRVVTSSPSIVKGQRLLAGEVLSPIQLAPLPSNEHVFSLSSEKAGELAIEFLVEDTLLPGRAQTCVVAAEIPAPPSCTLTSNVVEGWANEDGLILTLATQGVVTKTTVEGADAGFRTSFNKTFAANTKSYEAIVEGPGGHNRCEVAVTPLSCTGKLLHDACWFIGERGKSCDDTCKGKGGNGEATQNVVGDRGTAQACREVLSSFGYSIGNVENLNVVVGTGCAIYQIGGRGTSVPTSASASYPGVSRACACTMRPDPSPAPSPSPTP